MSERCRRLTAALAAMGVGHEDRVAALCTNSHVMLELHHAVPMRGAALVSVNIRLSPPEMAEIIRHSGPRCARPRNSSARSSTST
jgi:fatty-acyl-CoA synthase